MEHSFELLPFLTFAIVTSITPGPNNISAMAFCMANGYRKTLPYISGIALGTFVVFLICAALSYGLTHLVPGLTTYLKYIGAAYILYLAYKTSKMKVDDAAGQNVKAFFHDGAFLQLVNPKAIFYGMTIYSTFFQSFATNKLLLIVSALGLATFTFIIVSTWGLFGATLKYLLKNVLIKRVFVLLINGCIN